MYVILLTFGASVAALLGAYTALRSQKWINYALALTSGLVLGLVTFDLLPEIFDISQAQNFDFMWPMIAMCSGFLLFHFFERYLPLHESSEKQYGPHRHPRLGTARAMALAGHSFLDGLSIGVAFQIDATVGMAVAIAVIGHRFADGFDTTIFMLYNKNKLSHIKSWLGVVVLMPVIGGLASLLFSLSQEALAVYLGFFAGVILYIAASNLLPQAHSENVSRRTFVVTVVGAMTILLITRLG